MSVIHVRPPPARPSAAHTAPSPAAAHTPRRRSAVRWAPLMAVPIAVVGLLFAPAAGAAEAPVGLGTATSFAILAGAGVTNTGATTITGDVGTYPTTARTGFGTVVQTGVDHGGDAVTQQAKLDLVTAFDDAAGRGPVTATTPVDLAGQVLVPGVYNSDTIELSGALTLDAQNDPNAVFVFQAASTLITGSASSVNVINGAAGTSCNVYWKVGSSATLGSGSNFVGTVMAQESISLGSTAVVEGRLLARTGAVTLINNTITNTGCATIAGSPTTTTTAVPATTTTAAPEGTGGTGTDGTGGSGTGGSGTGGSGGSGTRGTPTGSDTPGITRTLAFTGSDWRLPVVGVVSILAGLACVAISTGRGTRAGAATLRPATVRGRRHQG